MDTSCTIDIRNVETVPDQITSGDSPRNVIVDSPIHEEESPGHMVSLGEEEDGLGDEQLVDVPSTLASSSNDVNLLLLHSNGVCFVELTIYIMRAVVNYMYHVV